MPLPYCFLNGHYLQLSEARISPLDRAFLFADAVYEVVPVYDARPFRLRQHLDRLVNSLQAIGMPPPMDHPQWGRVCAELISRNGGGDQYLYMQVTRGADNGRNHAWPDDLAPTVFAYGSALLPLDGDVLAKGVAAITAADTRWARRDIKSTSLLANVLLKKQAVRAGAFETILLQDGRLTEGSSTTVHIVGGNEIHTPPNGHQLLPGTTRGVVEELAPQVGLRVVSRPISEAELRGAAEIWLAFSTRGVLPVTSLDGQAVGNGLPGPHFVRMHRAFCGLVDALKGTPAL